MSAVVETGFTGIDYDLTHPRIGWRRQGGTIAATNATDGFAASNAGNPLTYTAWQPTDTSGTGSSWRLTFPQAAEISYLGIAAHTIGSGAATVTLRKLVSGSWSNWGGGTALSPTDDEAIFFLVEPQTVDGIGINITGGTLPKVGVIAAGRVLEVPRRAVWTGDPISESRTYRYALNQSDSGHWLGRTLIASGQSFTMEIANLPETFRRGEFEEFRDFANEEDATFFIAHRPGPYPEDAAYAWSDRPLAMSRARPNKAVSGEMSLRLQGYRAP